MNWVPKKTIDHNRVRDLLNQCEKDNHYTNGGPLNKVLQTTIRQQLSIEDDKEIVPVCNGALALWALASAIEMKANRKLRWATQSFTFPPSAQGVLENVKIVDIDKDGGLQLDNVSPEEVDGIIVTNIFGNVVDIQKYTDWCRLHNIWLLFDNAATSHTFYKGKNCLNYGNGSIISFHHTKPIGFGEGGAIIADKDLAPYLKRVINFGIDNSSPHPEWHKYGGNYKMSDISAAYVIQHLEKSNEMIEHTTSLYTLATTLLNSRDERNVKLFPNFGDTPFVSCLACLFESKEVSLKVEAALKEKSIYSRKYYVPLAPTPNASEIYDKILCISFHYQMTEEQVKTIVETVKL